MSRDTGPTQQTRDIVLSRDQGCVVCGRADLPYQIHHRRPRGMGGTSDPVANSPANLITLCVSDHAWVHASPEVARDEGFLVPQGRDPSKWTIEHAKWGLIYLLDSGSWVPLDEYAS